MGCTVVLIPFGPDEIDALDTVKKLAAQHAHCLKIELNAHQWSVLITSSAATSAELAETYSPEQRTTADNSRL